MKRAFRATRSAASDGFGRLASADAPPFDEGRIGDPHWMKDGRRFSYLAPAPNSRLRALWMYSLVTGERTLVIDPRSLKLPPRPKPTLSQAKAPGSTSPHSDLNAAAGTEAEENEDTTSTGGTTAIAGCIWSPDETQVLLARSPHRRAARGDAALYIYTVATKSVQCITATESEYHGPKWSPDGKRIGYVRDDEIWMLDLATLKEARLTHSATASSYNGVFGWVYAEELDLVDGWFWSPDGKRIAYFHTDETSVPKIPIIDYADLHCRTSEQRFPEPGDPNPRVKIGVIAVDAPGDPATARDSTVWLDTGPGIDTIIARMQWTPGGDILLQRLPRIQNQIDLLLFEVPSGKMKPVLSERSATWIDPPGVSSMLLSEDFHWTDPLALPFVGDSNQFLWLSDRSGYVHIYLYDLSGALIRQVTRGDWDVDTICGLDATHDIIYFTAARPNAMERQLFGRPLTGGGDDVRLSEEPGVHQCMFAPGSAHYLDTYSSRTVPLHTRVFRSSGDIVDRVHGAARLAQPRNDAPAWELTSFRTRDGVDLNAAILKPADFQPGKKYPVLMYVYGGPGSQTVVESHGLGGGLEDVLSRRGYIAAMVDGRGTGGRGRDFEKIVYRSLGSWEVHDQVEGARWLSDLPYVDPTRIGIWGASYGGFVASLCILQAPASFRAAIAVAPVTDWRLYDSIYTERYMRLPNDEQKAYHDSAPVSYADGLKGKFLLVHGTSDDNVHFQHSCRLAAALQQSGAQFETMFYPGQGHSLGGVSGHLFELMSAFIVQNL